MLDFYFTYPKVLRRLRDGALDQITDRIAAHFSDLGYSRASAKIYIGRLAKFSDFAARDARSTRIDQDVVDRFLLSFRTESRVSVRQRPSSTRARSRRSGFRRHAPWRTPMARCSPPTRIISSACVAWRARTCEGLLTSGQDFAWLRDNLPDQPLAKITGEHVLALVQHFLSLTANDFHPIRSNVAC